MTLLPALLLLASGAHAGNTIYLVGAGPGASPKVLSAIAKKATANFAGFGLRTQVKVFKGTFDASAYGRLEKSDSVALFGPPDAVVKAVAVFNAPAAKSLSSAAFGSNSGSINPEHSLNPRDGYGGNVIAVAMGATKTFSDAVGVSVFEGAAFLIVHGAGHNSNLQHAGEDNGWDPVTGKYSPGLYVPHTPNVMSDGGVIVRRIESQAFGTKEGKPKETLQSFLSAPANTAPADPKNGYLSIKGALAARFDRDAPNAVLPTAE